MFRTNIPVSPTSPRKWSVNRTYIRNYKKILLISCALKPDNTEDLSSQVDLEGKLKYLRNTGGFPGHNMLNNWSLWDQGGPVLVVANIDIWKLYQSWGHVFA